MKKLWLNGKIYTQSNNQKIVEAIVTEDDKIIFVGSNKDAIDFAGNDCEKYDFENKPVLPGFIDSHVHFMVGGFSLTQLDLGNAKSKDEFREMIRNYAKDNASEWILGGNWNHLQFDEKTLPTKEWLDDILPNKPAYLTRVDIHSALVNSAALKIAGITKDTPDPEGGQIIKDSNGDPTGILKDTAMDLVKKHIPPPTDEQYQNALTAAQNEAIRNGITSIHDITEEKIFNMYLKTYADGKLNTRINSVFLITHLEELLKKYFFNYGNNNWLRAKSVKAFADGALGSNTAWFFDPYKDEPNTCGLPTDYMLNEKLKEWALLADKNKLQLVVHAIGDRAISEVLDVFEEIVKTNPEWDRRFRIEHVQHIKEKDIERMKKLNVIASMQPSQLFDDGVWTEDKIGKERLRGTHAVNTLLNNGIKVCLGSDWTVTPLNVINGIDIAVNRTTKDGANPDGWIPNEKISVEEAIKSYTIDAAYASFEEDIKGSIEVGKLADFIVLSENIYEIPSDRINEVKVEKTILAGNVMN